MIYSKHKIPRPINTINNNNRNNGLFSPQYEPYPRMFAGQTFGFDHAGSALVSSADTELRKATSEPNLKIKGVQALRAKLIERQQKNRLVSAGGQQQDGGGGPSSSATAMNSMMMTSSQQQAGQAMSNGPPGFFATQSMPHMSGTRIQVSFSVCLIYYQCYKGEVSFKLIGIPTSFFSGSPATVYGTSFDPGRRALLVGACSAKFGAQRRLAARRHGRRIVGGCRCQQRPITAAAGYKFPRCVGFKRPASTFAGGCCRKYGTLDCSFVWSVQQPAPFANTVGIFFGQVS